MQSKGRSGGTNNVMNSGAYLPLYQEINLSGLQKDRKGGDGEIIRVNINAPVAPSPMNTMSVLLRIE